MDKMKVALLKQMNGQKIKLHCQNCNKDTIFIINTLGYAKCTELGCECEIQIDLSDTIKGLKDMGVFVK